MANEDFIGRPVIGKQIKLFAEILSAFNGGFESGVLGAMPTGWANDITESSPPNGYTGPFVATNVGPRTGIMAATQQNIGDDGGDSKHVKAIGWSDHMGLGLVHTDLTTGWPAIAKYKYMMELYAKKTQVNPPNNYVAPVFKWYTSAGVLISHTPSVQTKVTTAGSYQRAYCVDYAPSNAAKMNALIHMNGNCPGTDVITVDDVKLWIPLGICQDIKFQHDPQLEDVMEFGAVDPVEYKEKSNAYSGTFKNFYFGQYAYYLAKRMANGKLPEFTLRVVMEQGTERRVLNLLRCKIGKWEFSGTVGDVAGESMDFKYIGETRESGVEF